MEAQNPMADFFAAIDKDARISVTHIAVYAAVWRYWQLSKGANPFRVYSREIMRLAKVSASNTYHRVIRDLNAYGYLDYEPSFKRNVASQFRLLI